MAVEETIGSSQDLRDFVIVRKVKGGANFAGQRLGSTVRWYYGAHSRDAITDSKGNQVAKSEGAQLAMDLPDKFPHDVDLGAYITMATEALIKLGAIEREGVQLSVFTEDELAQL